MQAEEKRLKYYMLLELYRQTKKEKYLRRARRMIENCDKEKIPNCGGDDA